MLAMAAIALTRYSYDAVMLAAKLLPLYAYAVLMLSPFCTCCIQLFVHGTTKFHV